MSPLVVATVRVLSRRSIALWWVIGLFAGFFWALLAWSGVNNVGPPTQAALLIWRVVMALSLLFLGAQLATAALDTVRGDDALHPGRRRALADATVWLGCTQLLLFLGASALLGLLMNVWAPSWPMAAEASMALTTGAGGVIGASQRRYVLPFLLLSLALPLLGHDLTHRGVLVSTQAHWVVYAAWLAAWPACAMAMWWLLCKRPAPLSRLRTLEQATTMACDQTRRPSRGIEPMLGQARWLLRRPPSTRWLADVVGWFSVIVFFVWLGRSNQSPDISVLFVGMAIWWLVAYQTLREGVRPTLLLIPGRRVRQGLGWLLFAEGLRRGLLALFWPLAGGAVVLWFNPQIELMQILVVTCILWAGGALSLAWLLAIWVWLRSPFWRGLAQALVAGGSSAAAVIGAAAWYQNSAGAGGAHAAQGLLAAACAAVLSLLVVWAANRAWQRADLHALFSPSRQRISVELN
jgi:hypothetical protein